MVVRIEASGPWLHPLEDVHPIAKDDDLRSGTEARIAPAGRYAAWRIEDVEAFRARLRALGVPFEEVGGPVGRPQLFVKDPEGHT